MATDEGGELRRGAHVVNQNTDSPRVVTIVSMKHKLQYFISYYCTL